MSALVIRTLATPISLVVLVLTTISAAPPDAFRAPTPAEQEASLARLRDRLAHATSVSITHQTFHRSPAGFETRLPCRIQTTAGESSGRRDEAWARQLLECLQPDSFAIRHGGPTCRSGFTRSDHVKLEFGKGANLVTANVTLESGELLLSGADGSPYSVALGRRTAELRALLQQSLPEDTNLATAFVCSQPADAARPPAKGPAVGEYVYVEELPEALHKVAPVYPDAAREAGVSGQVMVQALIGKNGRVRETMIVHSIPMLDGAAITAVEQWEFRPAKSNGEPVAVWVAIPVKFALH